MCTAWAGLVRSEDGEPRSQRQALGWLRVDHANACSIGVRGRKFGLDGRRQDSGDAVAGCAGFHDRATLSLRGAVGGRRAGRRGCRRSVLRWWRRPWRVMVGLRRAQLCRSSSMALGGSPSVPRSSARVRGANVFCYHRSCTRSCSRGPGRFSRGRVLAAEVSGSGDWPHRVPVADEHGGDEYAWIITRVER
jgi:hypothetical protein